MNTRGTRRIQRGLCVISAICMMILCAGCGTPTSPPIFIPYPPYSPAAAGTTAAQPTSPPILVPFAPAAAGTTTVSPTSPPIFVPLAPATTGSSTAVTTGTAVAATTVPLVLRFTVVNPQLIEGEVTDPGDPQIVNCELHRLVSGNNGTQASCVATQQANKNVTGCTTGHGFSFALPGTGVVAGDYIAIRAISPTGKSGIFVSSRPVQ
jgi:hypothetical protein